MALLSQPTTLGNMERKGPERKKKEEGVGRMVGWGGVERIRERERERERERMTINFNVISRHTAI